jgi:group I intron endonuclease
MDKNCGIYKIINKIDGNYYVGSSSNVLRRWNRHKNNLNHGRHHNIRLLRAWHKYGEKQFEFEVIRNVMESELLPSEQLFLDVAANEKDRCYNLSFIAGKVEMTSEVKNKISLSKIGKPGKKGTENPLYGRKVPLEVRMKIRDSLMGAKNYNFGKSMTADRKKLIIESRLGINNQNYDYTIYKFLNLKTKDLFEGTRNEFYTKYELDARSVRKFIRGKFKTIAGWKLVK